VGGSAWRASALHPVWKPVENVFIESFNGLISGWVSQQNIGGNPAGSATWCLKRGGGNTTKSETHIASDLTTTENSFQPSIRKAISIRFT
jgi:hypothetical protein